LPQCDYRVKNNHHINNLNLNTYPSEFCQYTHETHSSQLKTPTFKNEQLSTEQRVESRGAKDAENSDAKGVRQECGIEVVLPPKQTSWGRFPSSIKGRALMQ